MANIELPDDIEGVVDVGADGVGLFRSEFLFMNRKDWPSEDEQFEAYASVVRAMGGRPVTIRTLDVGADKLDFAGGKTMEHMRSQANPALGLRAPATRRRIFGASLGLCSAIWRILNVSKVALCCHRAPPWLSRDCPKPARQLIDERPCPRASFAPAYACGCKK